MIKFSLIVPVYNVEDYLDECLKSIVKQNYNNYEVIIVNDGSTDNSLEIAKKYANKYPRLIKVYSKENGGLSSARNYGIEKAIGKYLFFIDSDDFIVPNCLKIIDERIEDNDILVFNYLTGTSYESANRVNAYDDSIKELKKRYIVGKPCAVNKICKRQLFDNVNFLDGVYYEDLATMPKLVFKAKKISFINDYLYFYRIRENSIMNNLTYNPKMDSIFNVLSQLKDYFKKEYKEEIEFLYIEHLLRGASLRYFDCENCKDQLVKIVVTVKSLFPSWNKNKYFKKESLKKRVMCFLFYKKWYTLIGILRK